MQGKQKDDYVVEVSFAKRKCHVNKNGKPHRELKWKDGKYLMSLVYQPDYLLDPVKPNKPGFYVSFDKETWFSTVDISESEKLPGFEAELKKYL